MVFVTMQLNNILWLLQANIDELIKVKNTLNDDQVLFF